MKRESKANGVVGRPATGKRSDAEYKGYLVYLKRRTRQRAAQVLWDSSQDFSELVQSLLEKWLMEQR
jgi:hypothetical protein